MNYEETIAYIHQTPKFSRELGNRLLSKLLLHCGNPQKELACVHIAGTNGKGSIAMMLAESLKQSGYKVGLFTSPYIERFNERIRIDGAPIGDDALAEIVSKLRIVIETEDAPVSEFALDTAAAFCYFAENKVDVVVLETGLGGRLDATNVIEKPLVSVIGTIALDHTQYLGGTLEEIAAEKCGIIKEACPVVSYPVQAAEASRVIEQTARERHAELFVTPVPTPTEHGLLFQGEPFVLGLKGEFQVYNAATVLTAIEVLRNRGFVIPKQAVKKGLARAKNPARCEWFGEHIVLDGAHNPQALAALSDTLVGYRKPVYFCVAMMEDKDIASGVKILAKHAKAVVTTQIAMPRCCAAKALADVFRNYEVETVVEEVSPQLALKKAIAMAGKDGLVCICGSLYLAGELRRDLKIYKDVP